MGMQPVSGIAASTAELGHLKKPHRAALQESSTLLCQCGPVPALDRTCPGHCQDEGQGEVSLNDLQCP